MCIPDRPELTKRNVHPRSPRTNPSQKSRVERGDQTGFMATARQVAEANVPVPTASPFMFELTAAAHNTSILESFDYNLATAIVAYPGTTISPGSELRPPEQLEPRLSHPTWQEFLGIHSTPNRGIQTHRPARQTRKGYTPIVFRYRRRRRPTRAHLCTMWDSFPCNEAARTPTSERQTERRDPSKPATSHS